MTDIQISPVADNYRWLRTGPVLWWQVKTDKDIWRTLLGWQLSTTGLAKAALRRMVPAAQAPAARPAFYDESVELSAGEWKQLQKMFGKEGAAQVASSGQIGGRRVKIPEAS